MILAWKHLRIIIEKPFFDNMIMLTVIMNTIILCLDGLIDEDSNDSVKSISKALTFIFLGELILKILAFGPSGIFNLSYF